MKKLLLILTLLIGMAALSYVVAFPSHNAIFNKSNYSLNKKSNLKKKRLKKTEQSNIESMDSAIVILALHTCISEIKFFISDDTSYVHGMNCGGVKQDWKVTEKIDDDDIQVMKRLINDIFITKKTKAYKSRERVNYTEISDCPTFTFKLFIPKRRMEKHELTSGNINEFYKLTRSEELDTLFNLFLYYGYSYNDKYLDYKRSMATEKYKKLYQEMKNAQ